MTFPDAASLPDVSGLMLKLSLLLVLGSLLGGCAAPVVVGTAGVAGAGTVAVDQRTLGTMVEDEGIEWKVRTAIGEADLSEDERHHIKVTSFNRIVLLTGQVPDEASKQRAGAEAGAVDQVRGVHNELVIGKPTTFGTRSADTVITGRVKVVLLAAGEDLPPPLNLNVKVVTEDGVVFLMGLVTREESEKITAITGTVPGIRQIVRLFEHPDE